MRNLFLLPPLLLMMGCASRATYVHSDTTLGRVVVYRNGVAYFERYATVNGNQLRLAVPGDKVDDFLKSLTVVDAVTGEPTPIAYPTEAPTDGNGTLDMHIDLPGTMPHRLKLTYVTESPSWKPSYRVTLGEGGKVSLQAWAIVDNTSGEDWNQVKLGVGSSSAMSFRFNLRSVRMVERETLQSDNLFALAPPTGESTYDGPAGQGKGGGKLAVDLSDSYLAQNVPPSASPTADVALSGASISASAEVQHKRGGRSRQGDAAAQPRASTNASPVAPAAAGHGVGVDDASKRDAQKFASVTKALRASNGSIVVEGYAGAGDQDKAAASLERANQAREQLVRSGVEANRIVAIGKGEETGHEAGVRIVEAEKEAKTKSESPAEARVVAEQPGEPIGSSHFESHAAMNVPRGSSAMVSILNAATNGEVVYLYDSETARGNSTYPFRAVHVTNPTDSALESGPVSVFGEGKFIGEGMCEPIPARSAAFVPFALDRQIVVEHKEAEHDEIARILTVQRGVLQTEVQHTKKQTITLHNRLPEKAVVYVRHTVAAGYKLTAAPTGEERMGNAHLYRVEVEPGAKLDVVLSEATPVMRTTDLRSPEGLDLVKAYVSADAVAGPLRAAIGELLEIHKDMANIEEHIKTTREQMGDYRQRIDELHLQIVTLRAVKSAGPLMQSLEKKMQEMSDKLSKSTIDLVSLEEKHMIARVHFQDKVADLSLDKPKDEKDEKKRAAL
jgi:outer membrane protein OmpA-like peptidoglycan-associated protein